MPKNIEENEIFAGFFKMTLHHFLYFYGVNFVRVRYHIRTMYHQSSHKVKKETLKYINILLTAT